MFRRKTVTVLAQGLGEEKSVYDCLNKLITAQTRVSEQQLRWAKTEDNPLFLCLFGRLAELNWMGNELVRQFQDKQTELNRVFRDIDQEERIVDESRKAFLACKTKCIKLQKQLEHSKKKNDTAKVQSIEIELTTQGSLLEHLRQSVETQSHKLELYKIDLLKKGLKSQAETYLEITLNYQALFNAQLQLADMIPHEPPQPSVVDTDENMEIKVSEEMKLFLSQICDSLNLYPPANGGINTKKLSNEAGQSPPHHRRSSADDIFPKMSRGGGKTQHSISQPILVGHNQSARLEEATQNQALLGPPILEEEVGAVTSGEYCEIESPGIPTDVGEEIKDEHIYTVTNTTRSPQGGGGGGIQTGSTDNNASHHHNSEEITSRDILKSRDLYKSRESVTNTERYSTGGASLVSSAEDLNCEKEVEPSPPVTRCSSGTSDECYANPVDAINEFLQSSNEGGISTSTFNESPTAEKPLAREQSFVRSKSGSDELIPSVHQRSKELQLQQFHERLFRDSCQGNCESEDAGACDRRGRDSHDYSEIEDEPTYSNPFDALNESGCRLFHIKAGNKLKRNVSLSSSALPQSAGSRQSNSPPPPPLPAKDEKLTGLVQVPVRYARRGSGENERQMPTSSGSASPILQRPGHNMWERREPVWKRNNTSGTSEVAPIVTQRMILNVPAVEKPQAPVSVSERLRQLRQRSQSDGVPVDEAYLHSRPPMPLPTSEQESANNQSSGRGQVQLNGQAHHMVHTTIIMNGSNISTPDSVNTTNSAQDLPTKNGKKQKAWLERSVSDQYRSVYYAKRGRAHVVPLSAKEIVKQHISHVAS